MSRVPCQLVGLVVALLLLVGATRPAYGQTLPEDSVWPLAGVRVLEPFDPPATRWGRGHRGVDLAAESGDPVQAAATGTISYAGMLAGRGVVVVDHGAVRTTYEPVTALVTVGQRVDVGQVIGRIAAGDHCSARCLHWGLIEGRDHYLDPMLLAPRGGGVRLLAADLRAEAEARADARARAAAEAAAAADAAGVQGFLGSGSGGSGFGGGQAGRGDFHHPVPGPITSGFGMRFHPVLHVWKLHDGTDFGAACGTLIRAAAAGRVSGSGYNRGYGNRLMLDHGQVNGRRVVTGYNHAARYVVHRGETVRAGQVIGYVGSTGYATGCHLHLMVWLDGRLRNPMTWFAP